MDARGEFLGRPFGACFFHETRQGFCFFEILGILIFSGYFNIIKKPEKGYAIKDKVAQQ